MLKHMQESPFLDIDGGVDSGCEEKLHFYNDRHVFLKVHPHFVCTIQIMQVPLGQNYVIATVCNVLSSD